MSAYGSRSCSIATSTNPLLQFSPMRFAFFPILAVAACLTACRDAPTGLTPSVAGNWNLRTVGGQPLPMTCVPINCPASSQLAGLGLRIDITGSSLSIAGGGAWSETLTMSVVTVTGTINQSKTIHGTYVRTGTFIHFTATADPEYMDCEITADALTCNDSQARYTR
jgi:hypothetical protein